MSKKLTLLLVSIATVALTSCGTMYHPDPHVQQGRRGGAVAGGVVGGVIGHNTDLGTAEGAAVGAVLGGILGDHAGKTNSMYYNNQYNQYNR